MLLTDLCECNYCNYSFFFINVALWIKDKTKQTVVLYIGIVTHSSFIYSEVLLFFLLYICLTADKFIKYDAFLWIKPPIKVYYNIKVTLKLTIMNITLSVAHYINHYG